MPKTPKNRPFFCPNHSDLATLSHCFCSMPKNAFWDLIPKVPFFTTVFSFCGTKHTAKLRYQSHTRPNCLKRPRSAPRAAPVTPSPATQGHNEARRPLRTIHHRKLPYTATASKKWPIRPHKPIHSPRFTSFPTEFSQETPNTTISSPLRPIFPVWRARYRNFICTLRYAYEIATLFLFFLLSLSPNKFGSLFDSIP